MIAAMDADQPCRHPTTEACLGEDTWDRLRRIFHGFGFMYVRSSPTRGPSVSRTVARSLEPRSGHTSIPPLDRTESHSLLQRL
jgi:hypothetical protein